MSTDLTEISAADIRTRGGRRTDRTIATPNAVAERLFDATLGAFEILERLPGRPARLVPLTAP